MKLKPWKIALISVALALGLYYLTIPNFGPYFAEVCSKGEYGPPDRCESWDIITALILRMFVVFDEHNGIVSAFAGVTVAVFTAVLWTATVGLWKSGERQHASSNRAFVYLETFYTELTSLYETRRRGSLIMEALPDGLDPELRVARLAVEPRWKNSGNTPTKNMRIQVNWSRTGPPPESFSYDADPVPFFIGPNAVEPSEIIEMGAESANDLINNGVDHVGANPLMLIWGRADYEDVFGRPHFTEWCYRVRFSRHDGQRLDCALIQWGPYNRTDEDDGIR